MNIVFGFMFKSHIIVGFNYDTKNGMRFKTNKKIEKIIYEKPAHLNNYMDNTNNFDNLRALTDIDKNDRIGEEDKE